MKIYNGNVELVMKKKLCMGKEEKNLASKLTYNRRLIKEGMFEKRTECSK